MNGTFEQARTLFLAGLAHYQAGRFAEAEASYQASLALLPERASTLANLGAVRLKQGNAQAALAPLEQALVQEPDDAAARGHRATALAALGRHPEALEEVVRALALDGTLGAAWSLRGNLLKDLGRPDEAIPCFEKAIFHGADPALNRYVLAALKGRDAPAAPPQHYVEMLFDGYAEQFDTHLVAALNYRAPEILAGELRTGGRRFARAVDLGCGTGLCGPLIRPLATRLEGIDLSGGMIERARALGVYDALTQADVSSWLASAGGRYDLVLAADVFIYVGALEAVFRGAARVMDEGGVFCFSVEAADDNVDHCLRPSLRYAHSERSLMLLAERHGFDVTHRARLPIREEQGVPIPGLYVWLVKR